MFNNKDGKTMSDQTLIEKLIKFLESSAVSSSDQTPFRPPEANAGSVLASWELHPGIGRFGH